jgi:hypothetical protein
MFARHSGCPDATFLTLETRRKIRTALTEETELRVCEVSPPDVDPQVMAQLAELLETNKVLQMAKIVPSPIV